MALLCLYSINFLSAQGCVAIRTVGGLCTMEHAAMHQEDSSKWNLNINYRYFKSYKHFNGTDEQKYRVAEGSEVINYTSAMDFSLIRTLRKEWMIGINIPLVNYERTSKYEHLGNTSPYRFATSARGLGDIRLSAYRWLIAPSVNKKGNLIAGLGIKLPTGNFKAQDEFQYQLNARRVGYVDQSIQPGDGGVGVTVELNGFRQINLNWSAYANAFYLLNPRDHNGVSTARGGTPSATAIKYTSNVMSVADQYMLRSGFNIDFAVIAAAHLPSEHLDHDFDSVHRTFSINTTGLASFISSLTSIMSNSGGTLLYISSVACMRPRIKNFTYGASKRSIDFFVLGLAAKYKKGGFDIRVVRPGFVHSKLSKGFEVAPFATKPERVAKDVMVGLKSKRQILYSPRILRIVMNLLKLLPSAIFSKL